MGKSKFLDDAFELTFTKQFNPKERSKFQIGSVDLQMSHNLFSEGSKAQKSQT